MIKLTIFVLNTSKNSKVNTKIEKKKCTFYYNFTLLKRLKHFLAPDQSLAKSQTSNSQTWSTDESWTSEHSGTKSNSNRSQNSTSDNSGINAGYSQDGKNGNSNDEFHVCGWFVVGSSTDDYP